MLTTFCLKEKNEMHINSTSKQYLLFCRTLNNINKSRKGPWSSQIFNCWLI